MCVPLIHPLLLSFPPSLPPTFLPSLLTLFLLYLTIETSGIHRAEPAEDEDEDEDEEEDVSILSSTIPVGVVRTLGLGLGIFGSPTINIWQNLVADILPGQQANRALSA